MSTKLLAVSCLVAVSCTAAVEVAIIGGGIAGVTTALELLLLNETVKDSNLGITIYENSSSLLDSTSANIAATISFDEMNQFFYDQASTLQYFDNLLNAAATNGISTDEFGFFSLGLLEATRQTDSRVLETHQSQFFKASYLRMLELVNKFPELMCTSIVGDWCCQTNSTASIVESAGLNCNELGVFHVFEDDSYCAETAQRNLETCSTADVETQDECLTQNKYNVFTKYNFYNADQTRSKLSAFLQDDASEVKCSVVERKLSGYGRGEKFFELAADLLTSRGVEIKYNCPVNRLDSINEGDRVRVLSEGCASASFDKTIVASGSYSAKLLEVSEIDLNIVWQLVGAKGFILTGSDDNIPGIQVVPAAQNSLAVQLEDRSLDLEAAFMRSFRTLDEQDVVRVAGGAELTAGAVLPPYEFASSDRERQVFESSAAAQELLSANATTKVAGIRPISYFVNFPLIKQYLGKWRTVTLNTGYGFHGWALAWKSSQIAAALALGQPVEGEFEGAYTVELYSEASSTCQKVATIGTGSPQAILIGFAIGFGTGMLLGIMVRCCMYPTKRCKRKESNFSKLTKKEAMERKEEEADQFSFSIEDETGAMVRDVDSEEAERVDRVRHKRANTTSVKVYLFVTLVLTLVFAFAVEIPLERGCVTFGCADDQVCLYGKCVCDVGLCFQNGKCAAVPSSESQVSN